MTLSRSLDTRRRAAPPLSRVAVAYVTNEAEAHATHRPKWSPMPPAAGRDRPRDSAQAGGGGLAPELRDATARCKGTLAGLLRAKATRPDLRAEGQLRRLKPP